VARPATPWGSCRRRLGRRRPLGPVAGGSGRSAAAPVVLVGPVAGACRPSRAAARAWRHGPPSGSHLAGLAAAQQPCHRDLASARASRIRRALQVWADGSLAPAWKPTALQRLGCDTWRPHTNGPGSPVASEVRCARTGSVLRAQALPADRPQGPRNSRGASPAGAVGRRCPGAPDLRGETTPARTSRDSCGGATAGPAAARTHGGAPGRGSRSTEMEETRDDVRRGTPTRVAARASQGEGTASGRAGRTQRTAGGLAALARRSRHSDRIPLIGHINRRSVAGRESRECRGPCGPEPVRRSQVVPAPPASGRRVVTPSRSWNAARGAT
jgi:hypothetical protein